MEIGLDLATLIVAIIFVPIGWYIANRWSKAQEEQRADADRRMQDAAAEKKEERRKTREKRDAERRERQERHANESHRLEARRDRREELQEAFSMHEALTTQEVFAALADADVKPQARGYLVQLYNRSSRRYQQFSDTSSISPEVEELIQEAMATIARVVPSETEAAQADFTEKTERRGNDRSKYLVDGQKLTKFQTLHTITLRFVRDRGITTAEEFARQWGGIMAEALGDSVTGSSFDTSDVKTLLTDPTEGSPSYLRRYAPKDQQTIDRLGALELDGKRYLLGWPLGLKPMPAAIGRRVHRPVIEYFRANSDYDIEPA